jgi:hypothetical protein
MTSENNRGRSLREIELEVLEEGREWTRQRLEQKLQEEANRQGGFFPPQQKERPAWAKAAHDSEKRRRRGKVGGLLRPRPR